jgi:thiamine biosynthesis lipoprotein
MARAGAIALALICGALNSGCEDANDRLRRFEFHALGTLIEVSLWDVGADTALAAERALIADFTRAQQEWHPWGGGALSEFNRALRAGREHRADAELKALITAAFPAYRSSSGLFDPAIGALVQLWGFHHEASATAPPPAQAINAWLAHRPVYSDLKFDNGVANSSNPAVWLDFGAFAKGYAIDQAIERLRRLGIRNAIINAGGDLRAIGARGNRPWRIGIRQPRGAGIMASIEIAGNESLVTSGDYERFFIHDGVRYHHILDPRTGYPAPGCMSVTVAHQSAAVADAAATALFVAGPSAWRQVAAAMGITQVMLVGADGKIEMTDAMASRIRQLALPLADPVPEAR